MNPMTDPVGLIGSINHVLPPMPAVGPGGGTEQGPGFRQLLNDQIEKVNQLQRDATEAIEDLAVGKRDDIESVLPLLNAGGATGTVPVPVPRPGGGGQ